MTGRYDSSSIDRTVTENTVVNLTTVYVTKMTGNDNGYKSVANFSCKETAVVV